MAAEGDDRRIPMETHCGLEEEEEQLIVLTMRLLRTNARR